MKKLKTRYENQGHNGIREVIVGIIYDPETDKEYDVADLYEMKDNNKDVYKTDEVKEED
jgi:peptidyl-tRNA hydrolase